jgi:hypothetical protein
VVIGYLLVRARAAGQSIIEFQCTEFGVTVEMPRDHELVIR